MIGIYTKFTQGIRWNALESLAYHGIFLTHQLALFRTVNQELYGSASALIAGTYFIVMLANGGLDLSFGPFFTTLSSCAYRFRHFALRQMIVQVALLTACAIAALMLTNTWMSHLGISLMLRIILVLIVISEGIKRSLRTLLQLAFLNRTTTWVEILYISLYSFMVWSWYLINHECTLMSLLLPLLLCSLLSTIFLARTLHAWYAQLPLLEHEKVPSGLWRRIITTRVLGFLTTTGQQLFSSNMLTPALAMQSGLQTAGVFSLIATLISSLTNIFHKVGGYTTQALLAHIKNEDLATKQSAFSFITTQLFHILAMITCLLVINYGKLLHYNTQGAISSEVMIAAYLYLGLILLEYLSMVYEKFLINEERTDRLGLFHATLVGACLLAISCCTTTTSLSVILLAIRIAGLAGLSISAYYNWGIKPRIVINPLYLLGSLTASLALYYLL